MKKFTLLLFFVVITALSYGQVFTGVNWVNWGNEPDYPDVFGYAENPYETPTYTVFKAPASWNPVADVASFDATWELLGEAQYVANPGNIPGGDIYDLGTGNTFGAAWKAVHDGERFYVLLKYWDTNSQADAGTRSFEIMAQPKDPVRHEATFAAGVADNNMAKKNMAYGRYVELGGGKALFRDGDVVEYAASIGLTGQWGANTPALEAFLDLDEYIFWDNTGGIIRAVLPMDFAGVLSYPNNPEDMTGARTALAVGDVFAFDVKSNAKKDAANSEYWWSADKNNGYASNYYSGHLTISDQVLGGVPVEPADVYISDFENGELGGWYTWGGAVSVVDNPAPGGINTSSKVMKYEPTGQWQGPAKWDDVTYFGITAAHKVFAVDVYCADPEAQVQLLFVDSEGGAGSYGRMATVGVANKWVRLKFDLTGMTAHDYKQFALQNTAVVPYFFDNVIVYLEDPGDDDDEIDVAFTGVNWVNWANEPDYPDVFGYAENPYNTPTYTVYKAPAAWNPVSDNESFDATWEVLGAPQYVANPGNIPGGDLYDLGSGNTFGAAWKAVHNGSAMFVLLKYWDTNSQADAGTRSFEIMAQPKSPVRHEPTFQKGVADNDMAKKNMAYGRYVELGGGKAFFANGFVTEYPASIGMTGQWGANTPGLEAFLDLDEYMFWDSSDGIIRAVLPMDFAGVLSYPNDPREVEGARTALKVGDVFAFDVKSNAKKDAANSEYWWSANKNNGYASNYYSGHLTISAQELVSAPTLVLNVKMRYWAEEYNRFNPAEDYVDVAGTLNDWNGENHKLVPVPNDPDMMQTITITGIEPGTTLEFKFRINGSWDNDFHEFPAGGPNRVVVMAGGMNEYTYWFNDEDPTTSVNEPLAAGLLVYPNPAREILNVVSDMMIQELRMVNALGQVVYATKAGTEQVQIPVSNLDGGLYFIQVLTVQGVSVQRVMISR